MNAHLKDLFEINLVHQSLKGASYDLSDNITEVVETCVNTTYDDVKELLRDSIVELDNIPTIVKFSGFSNITGFAIRTQVQACTIIFRGINRCEDYARMKTSEAVDDLMKISSNVLGNQFSMLFLPHKMYTKQRFGILPSNSIILADFFDPSMERLCEIFQIQDHRSTESLFSREMFASLLAYVAMYVGFCFGLSKIMTLGTIDTINRGALFGLLIGVPGYYVYKDAPYAYQRNTIKRVKSKLSSGAYQHSVAEGISREVYSVLNHMNVKITDKMKALLNEKSFGRNIVLNKILSLKPDKFTEV